VSDLKPCPFCGATPHRQMTKAVKVFVRDEPDGTGHYENEQHEVAKCPHGCATLTPDKWNTRARDAEVARLREALDNARESMMDLRKESPRSRLVEGMERTRDIVRKALAANPTSERVVPTVEDVARLVDSWVLDNIPNGLPYLAYTDTLSKAIHALLQRKVGR